MTWPSMFDQRAARVARVDRRVGLEERLVLVDADVVPLGGRDDARWSRVWLSPNGEPTAMTSSPTFSLLLSPLGRGG